VELVTKVEAARRLGVSIDTIERKLRRGELKAHKQPRPQGFTWMIQVPEEPLQTPGNTGVIPSVDTPESTSATNAEVLRLEELAEVLKDEVAQLRRQLQSQTETHEKQNEAYQQQLEAKDKQIEQLHVLLQQAPAALPAPRDNRSWWQRLWRRG
jgi:Tfp pilus assembly protein FimV